MRSTAFYERAISYNRCTNKKNDERRERENEKARKGLLTRVSATETESGEISNPFDISALLICTLSTNPGTCSMLRGGCCGTINPTLALL